MNRSSHRLLKLFLAMSLLICFDHAWAATQGPARQPLGINPIKDLINWVNNLPNKLQVVNELLSSMKSFAQNSTFTEGKNIEEVIGSIELSNKIASSNLPKFVVFLVLGPLVLFGTYKLYRFHKRYRKYKRLFNITCGILSVGGSLLTLSGLGGVIGLSSLALNARKLSDSQFNEP